MRCRPAAAQARTGQGRKRRGAPALHGPHAGGNHTAASGRGRASAACKQCRQLCQVLCGAGTHRRGAAAGADTRPAHTGWHSNAHMALGRSGARGWRGRSTRLAGPANDASLRTPQLQAALHAPPAARPDAPQRRRAAGAGGGCGARRSVAPQRRNNAARCCARARAARCADALRFPPRITPGTRRRAPHLRLRQRLRAAAAPSHAPTSRRRAVTPRATRRALADAAAAYRARRLPPPLRRRAMRTRRRSFGVLDGASAVAWTG